jgi:hypothetical protein
MWVVGHFQNLGRLRTAVEMAKLAVRILKHVAEADPASAEKQRDVGVSHFKLMDSSEKAGDRPAAREHLQHFVAVWGQLEAEGRLPSPTDQRILHNRRKQLAGREA